MDRYEISEINLGKNEYICLELFEVWVLTFSLKLETMTNIRNQNMPELAHYIRSGDTGILPALAIQEFYFGIYFSQDFWSHHFST